MRGADDTGTYRAQIHRLILAERGHDRCARHLGGGGSHLADQHQQKTAVRADELLPERALLGDDYAREELYQNVYRVLHGDNPDDPTFVTVSTFLRNGSSLENTAKDLNVHPNTVRYRLKRAAETTGWDATDPRDAYVLTTALAIGRMRDR